MADRVSINLRAVALDTLIEILEHGQFSHSYLKAVLDKYAYLEKSERAFITRLTNGVVERRLQLDFIIDSFSRTKATRMKPVIRTIIRMGTYEIFYMDSVPASATCNEYVKLAKKRGFAGLSGFVNGLLRSISRQVNNIDFTNTSIKYSMPEWIVEKWEADYGKSQTEEILAGFFEKEDLCIRANLRKISREELSIRLKKQGISVRICDTVPSALYISDFDSLAAIREFSEGLFYVQDYSSQLVAYKAGIRQEDHIIDACAAPGGKALHAAELACRGQVLACDVSESKVALIQENIDRIGALNIEARVHDATIFDDALEDSYDVVIADLPCSGLGIIRKKPDIKYNQTQASLKELADLQARILNTVCRYTKAGGTLCYSTCTINKDENENQVEGFLKTHSDFKMVECMQLFPDKDHDGFFICVMKKN